MVAGPDVPAPPTHEGHLIHARDRKWCMVMSEVIIGREPVAERLGPPLIELAGVEKVYRTGKVEFRALRGIDLTIDDGEMVAIVGPSGSGKSTIMNMIT